MAILATVAHQNSWSALSGESQLFATRSRRGGEWLGMRYFESSPVQFQGIVEGASHAMIAPLLRLRSACCAELRSGCFASQRRTAIEKATPHSWDAPRSTAQRKEAVMGLIPP